MLGSGTEVPPPLVVVEPPEVVVPPDEVVPPEEVVPPPDEVLVVDVDELLPLWPQPE